MVGVDWTQVDPSPPSSVIVITPLHLMVLGMPRCWLDVWNLVSLDSIGAWLANSQDGRFVYPQRGSSPSDAM